jgi:hypothetical protein
MEMVKRGVNSQPKIGTKQPWVGWKKKAVKFDPVLDEISKKAVLKTVETSIFGLPLVDMVRGVFCLCSLTRSDLNDMLEGEGESNFQK